MVLAGFIGLPGFADQLSAPPSSGLTTTAAESAGMRAPASRDRYAVGMGGPAGAAGSAAAADAMRTHAMPVPARNVRICLIRARLLRPRLRVDSSHRIEGVFLLSSPSRHVRVACLVVAVLS